MGSNLERFNSDIARLTEEGDDLLLAIMHDHVDGMKEKIKALIGKDERKSKALPSFRNAYQQWYSEARSLVKALLPDRIEDFVRYYEKPKSRKDILASNYVIEDCLKGTMITTWDEKIVAGPADAVSCFQQQLNIVKSCQRRLESSLFDLRQIVRADLFDSEIDAARELNKNGFCRGAGAMAGVVLEGHLFEVCKNHKISIKKKSPGINDLNQSLKDNEIIEMAVWRFIQHLGDLRNKCDHKKVSEPDESDMNELIDGVDKILKTVF